MDFSVSEEWRSNPLRVDRLIVSSFSRFNQTAGPLFAVLSIYLEPNISFQNAFKMQFQFPSWMQWVKKPNYVDIKEFADRRARSDSVASSRASIDSSSSRDIPAKLSLERILKNQTCTSIVETLRWRKCGIRVFTDQGQAPQCPCMTSICI